jgi:hypothetical protein
VGRVEGPVVETRSSTSRPLCATVSAESGESLAATASRVDHWLIVEYRHLWPRDTLGGSALPDEVKEHLRAQVDGLANARLLFVRRPDRRGTDSHRVFVARSTEEDSRVHRLEIGRYEELLDLDARAALAGEAAGPRLEHPLLVVCTHGKRDRCCAKFGRPLYDELREEADPEWVWQSTHVGGDRFAGNLVCLPEGLYFGRVGRSDVWSLLDEYLAGRIELAHYRGRSCHPFAVQAAERRVREETGAAGIRDVRLVTAERPSPDRWNVAFEHASARERHELEVVRTIAEHATYLTCSSPLPSRPWRYRVTSYRRPDR